MPRLLLKKDKRLIAGRLTKAQNFSRRIKGLIGRKGLEPEEAFWIPACPSIHTFFMKFPIDAVFTDNNFCIQALFENTPPWRILFGGFKSQNVFEMEAGSIQKKALKKGDELYVEP